MCGTGPNHCLEACLVMCLWIVSGILIATGPITRLMREEITYIEEFKPMDLVGVELPTITVCRWPGFKNKINHVILLERNPNKSLSEIIEENSFKTEDDIIRIYLDLDLTGHGHIYLNKTDFKSYTVDLRYFGVCWQVPPSVIK